MQNFEIKIFQAYNKSSSTLALIDTIDTCFVMEPLIDHKGFYGSGCLSRWSELW